MAKRFQFRLENVLQWRNRLVREAEGSLGKAVGARVQKQQEIEQARRYHEDLQTKPATRRVSVREMEAHWYHSRTVQHRILSLENEKRQLSEIESLKRTELSEAMQKQRVLEKLRDKRFEVYRRESDREQQQFLDDIARNTNKKGFR